MIPPCPLCDSTAHLFHQTAKRRYFKCDVCGALFMDPRQYLSPEEEKARYDLHENDVEDPRYQQFVAPLVGEIMNDHEKGSHGLDYGSGTGPVAAKLLGDAGYKITLYDPFFDDEKTAFQHRYDFIFASEVVEHFHHPAKEFRRLKNLLKPGGHLYGMTLRYEPDIDFESWHYNDDETHVIFYQDKTARWIKKHFHFSDLRLKERLMIFER